MTEICVKLGAKSWQEYEGVRFENHTNLDVEMCVNEGMFLKPIFKVKLEHEEGTLK